MPTKARVLKTVRRLLKAKVIAIDTETTGLQMWHGDQPFAVGFRDLKGNELYFEWEVDPWTRVVVPDPWELAIVKKICEAKGPIKVFHNAKFDIRMLEEAYGIFVRGPIHDTMFMVHICNSQEPSFKLKDLALKYRDIDNEDEKELKKLVVKCRRRAKKEGMSIAKDVPADYWLPRIFDKSNQLCRKYCLLDVKRTILLWELFDYGIREEGLEETWERELALWPVTYEMEKRGVRVDPAEIDVQIVHFQKEAARWKGLVEKKAAPFWKKHIKSGLFSTAFNIESNAHLARLYYEDLGIKPTKKTKGGAWSVDVDSLFPHLENPTVAAHFHYKACGKALSTYFEKYHDLKTLDKLNPGGWCIHPDFRQMGPGTGRYSCRNPNLQNVANALTTRSPMPIQARTPFGPRPGYVWYHPDYSQVEVRIFADVAQEQTMLGAIASGEDMHTACTNKAWGGRENPAAVVAAIHTLEFDGTGMKDNDGVNALWKEWGVKSANVLTQEDAEALAFEWLTRFDFDIVKAEKSIYKKTCRAKAKMILFAKIFGGGPNAVKDLLQCTWDEAAGFLNDYDRAMPDIKRYIRTFSDEARTNGFIFNRYNRRLSVDPRFAYRAVNYMVQGSAADLLKEAMIKCVAYLKGLGIDAHLVLTIHDELVFEFYRPHARRSVLKELIRIMEDHGGRFGVPLPVEMDKVVSRWNEKEPVIL
jgi:DNA polymerase I-like protein with 3'-5' exonuclease and polymerase domains